MTELTGVTTGAIYAVISVTCVPTAGSCGVTSGTVITAQHAASAAISAGTNATCVPTAVTCAPTAETSATTGETSSRHATNKPGLDGGHEGNRRPLLTLRYFSKDSVIHFKYSSLPLSILITTNSGTS